MQMTHIIAVVRALTSEADWCSHFRHRLFRRIWGLEPVEQCIRSSCGMDHGRSDVSGSWQIKQTNTIHGTVLWFVESEFQKSWVSSNLDLVALQFQNFAGWLQCFSWAMSYLTTPTQQPGHCGSPVHLGRHLCLRILIKLDWKVIA